MFAIKGLKWQMKTLLNIKTYQIMNDTTIKLLCRLLTLRNDQPPSPNIWKKMIYFFLFFLFS